jgi:hypothetical protein
MLARKDAQALGSVPPGRIAHEEIDEDIDELLAVTASAADSGLDRAGRLGHRAGVPSLSPASDVLALPGRPGVADQARSSASCASDWMIRRDARLGNAWGNLA